MNKSKFTSWPEGVRAMKKVYAVCEGERAREYITPGKKYEVFPSKFGCFRITDDDGDPIDCAWHNCQHLYNGNWTRIEEDEDSPQTEQKTLRDEFALNWLLGYMSNPETPHLSYQEAAEVAYKIADAMLEARKSTRPNNKTQGVINEI